ncbi:MAG: hypothetical protein ACRC1W_17990, partial [Shewanella sp.]
KVADILSLRRLELKHPRRSELDSSGCLGILTIQYLVSADIVLFICQLLVFLAAWPPLNTQVLQDKYDPLPDNPHRS